MHAVVHSPAPNNNVRWLSMRIVLFKVLAVAVASVWLSGCAPLQTRYTSAPGATGRVVDADTHAPIRGALVTVTRPEDSPAQTKTARDGKFRVSSQHRWFFRDALRPCKHIYISAPAILTVEHEGYRVDVTQIQTGEDVLDVGEISLRALPQ